MPTIRIPVNINWGTASGSPGVNIFHGRVVADTFDPNPDLNSLSTMLNTFYEAVSDIFPGFVTIRFDGEAAGVGDDAGNTYSSPAWTVNGSGGANFLPPANAMLVSWRTSTGGANGRGRTFLGPLDTGTNQDNGTPTEGTRDSVQAAANALVTSSQSFGNGAIGVYSRTTNVFRDVTSANVPNLFAVLRSRRD